MSAHTHTAATPAAKQVSRRLSAMRLVHAPRGARWLAWTLVVLFLVSPIFLVMLPWQQNVQAAGRVVAFDATERLQDIESPIDGRIVKWHVQEGDRVKGPVMSPDGKRVIKPGDLLVSIQDPDPELPKKLADQKAAVAERMTAAKSRVASFGKQIVALQSSQTVALLAADQRISMAKERLKAANEAITVASLRREIESTNYLMERDLRADGLTSRLMFLTAKQRMEGAEAEERRTVASRDAAKDEIEAIKADKGKIKDDAEAAISNANASRQAAEAEVAQAQRDMADIEVRIARQDAQEVTAPCDGTVYRIIANSSAGGALVKSTDRLLSITPDIKNPGKRMVELFMEGNDAPQLTELWRMRLERGEEAGFPVRLQFEGYPAIQVVGWPSVAWGTFAGKVVFVDAHDDGKGRFRVLVAQDDDGGPAWPQDISLRQGLRAQGWVLLDRVTLGYEMWRRFNGFPPVVTGKDKDDGELKKKPGKVKVPK